MLKYKRSTCRGFALSLTLCTVCCGLAGCTKDEAALVTALETGLNQLVQNRALAEQAVRDVRALVPTSDPNYVQAMESYQNARSSYDHFLDAVEDEHNGSHSRSLRDVTPGDVQSATADFMTDAVVAIKPTLNTRRIPIKRAIVIPENLQSTLMKLPKKSRAKLIDKFDEQVRWRSWSELN